MSSLATALVGAVVAREPPASTTKARDDRGANTFAIRGARVFDGARDLGIGNVVVREGRIAAVVD